MQPGHHGVIASLLCAGLWLAHSAFAAPVTALTFSPDGAALVSNGARSIEVRSANDGSVSRRIACDLRKVTAMAFQPRGDLLAVAGGVPGVGGAVQLFSWDKWKLVQNLTNHTDLVTAVAFNANGTLLGVAGADHSARIWRVTEGGSGLQDSFALAGHAGPVLAIAFNPTGKSIVTASADRSVKVWSSDDGRLQRSFAHHTETVHTLAFRPLADEGGIATCASGGDDRTVRVWQPEIGRMVRIIRGHRGPIFALAYSRDGRSLFSAGKEGIVRRIDADSDAILEEWPAHSDWIYALAVSPDGAKLATGDWTGKVTIRNVRGAVGSSR